MWERASLGNVPQGALQGGYTEAGEPLYIGRFNHGGSLICGKVGVDGCSPMRSKGFVNGNFMRIVD